MEIANGLKFDIDQVQGAGVQTSANNVLQAIITLFFTLAAIATLFYLISGGISYITSGGDPKQTAKAKEHISAAIIGIIIVFLSFAIIRILEQFFRQSLLYIPY